MNNGFPRNIGGSKIKETLSFKCHLKKITVPVKINFLVTIFAKNKKEGSERVKKFFDNMSLSLPITGTQVSETIPIINLGKCKLLRGDRHR